MKKHFLLLLILLAIPLSVFAKNKIIEGELGVLSITNTYNFPPKGLFRCRGDYSEQVCSCNFELIRTGDYTPIPERAFSLNGNIVSWKPKIEFDALQYAVLVGKHSDKKRLLHAVFKLESPSEPNCKTEFFRNVDIGGSFEASEIYFRLK